MWPQLQHEMVKGQLTKFTVSITGTIAVNCHPRKARFEKCSQLCSLKPVKFTGLHWWSVRLPKQPCSAEQSERWRATEWEKEGHNDADYGSAISRPEMWPLGPAVTSERPCSTPANDRLRHVQLCRILLAQSIDNINNLSLLVCFTVLPSVGEILEVSQWQCLQRFPLSFLVLWTLLS